MTQRGGSLGDAAGCRVLGPGIDAALEISMLTKPLLLIILAACAAPSGAAVNSNSPERDPPELAPPPNTPQPIETFWCCDAIIGKGEGDGCDEITASKVALCSKVLHCTDGYDFDEGKVTCH
jgi:hypothetical protein